MNRPVNFYKESGSFNIATAVIAFAILLILSLVLGYAYAVIVQVIPIIYLSVLAAVGAGIAISFVLNALMTYFKLRNKTIRFTFAVAIGLLTWYFQWTATLLYLFENSAPSIGDYLSSLAWMITDADIVSLFNYLYEEGYYEVGKVVVKGPVLGIIWIIEFAIFLGAPLLQAFRFEPKPYSDQYEKWYDRYVIEHSFRTMTASQLAIQELSDNPIEKIKSLGDGRVGASSVFSIYYLSEASKQYLHVANLTYEGKNNDEKFTTVINCLEISKDQAQQIMHEYKCNKV